jgi:hypothetical protein
MKMPGASIDARAFCMMGSVCEVIKIGSPQNRPVQKGSLQKGVVRAFNKSA